MCFDAKVNFDDNAEYRQEKVFSMRDTNEEDPREVCSRFGHMVVSAARPTSAPPLSLANMYNKSLTVTLRNTHTHARAMYI